VVTGAVTDATRALHDAGAIDPQTPVEAMSVIGDAALLAWAAESRVRLRPSTVVHCADHLASIPRFVAVLGSLAVGADGSLAAHRIGGRDVSGLGGAPDLAAGAHRSLGGLTVAALRSRDRHGRPALVDAVEAVTVAGEQVDAVVTERGTALLHGLSDGRRRAALEAVFQASPIRQHRC
jgi:acyl-CoA hydrolase